MLVSEASPQFGGGWNHIAAHARVEPYITHKNNMQFLATSPYYMCCMIILESRECMEDFMGSTYSRTIFKLAMVITVPCMCAASLWTANRWLDSLVCIESITDASS